MILCKILKYISIFILFNTLNINAQISGRKYSSTLLVNVNNIFILNFLIIPWVGLGYIFIQILKKKTIYILIVLKIKSSFSFKNHITFSLKQITKI